MAVRTLQEIVEEFIGTLIRDNNVLKNEVKDIASNTLSELKTMNINTARMNVTEREMIISTIKNEIGKRLMDMYKGNKSVVAAIKNINKSLKIKQTPTVVVRDDAGKFVSAKDPTAQKIIMKDEAGNTNITDKSDGEVFKEMLDRIINKGSQKNAIVERVVNNESMENVINNNMIETNVIEKITEYKQPKLNEIVLLCDTLSITNERIGSVAESMHNMTEFFTGDKKTEGYLEDLTKVPEKKDEKKDGFFKSLLGMKKDKETDAYYSKEKDEYEREYAPGFKGFQDKLFDKVDEVIEILSYGNAIEGAQTGMLASMTGFLGLNRLAAWFGGIFGFKALGGTVKGLGKFIAMIPLAIGKWIGGFISTAVGGLVARMAGVPFIAAIMAKIKGPFAAMKGTSGLWARFTGSWFGAALGGFFKTLGGVFGKIFFPIAIIQAGIETLFATDSEIERVTGEGGKVQYFFTKMISSIVGIVDIFTGALSWLTGFDLSTDLSGKVENMIKGMVDWFRDGGLTRIWEGIKNFFNAIMAPIKEVGIILMPLFEMLWEDIKSIGRAVKFIGGIAWEITKGIAWAIGWLGENILFPVIKFVWNIFTGLLKIVVGVIVKIRELGGLIWDGIKLLGTGLAWLGKNILFPAIEFMWDKVKSISGVIGWVADKIRALGGLILSGVMVAVNAFEWLGDKIIAGVKMWWEGWKWIGNKMLEFGQWIWNFSFTDWISGLWTGFKEWVGGLWDSAVNWSHGVDMFILEKVSALKKWYDEFSFTDWIGDLWDGLKDFVSNMWDEIMDELKMLWTNLKELGYKYTLGLPGTIANWVTGKDEKVDEKPPNKEETQAQVDEKAKENVNVAAKTSDVVPVLNKPVAVETPLQKVPEPTSGLWDNIKSLGNFLVEASPKKEKDTEYKRFFERENNNTENIVEMKKAKDPTVEGVHNFTSNNKSVMVNNTYNVSNSTENTSVSGGSGGGSFVISATPDGKNAAAMGEA